MRAFLFSVVALACLLAGVVLRDELSVGSPGAGAWTVVGLLLGVAAAAIASLIVRRRGGAASGRRIRRGWLSASVMFGAYVAVDALAGLLFLLPPSPALVADAVIHHRMVPGTRSRHRTGEFDVEVHVNRFGLRGRREYEAKAAGTFRIVTLGDSFTFGVGVGEDETFSAVLERSLDADGGREVEVVNAGVPSYAPILSRLQLQGLTGIRPDLVILGVDMSDLLQEESYRALRVLDYEDRTWAVPGDHPSSRRVLERAYVWANEHLFLTRFALYHVRRRLAAGDPSPNDLIAVPSPRLLEHTLEGFDATTGSCLGAVLDSVRSLAQDCESRGVAVLVATYPWGHQVSKDEWASGRDRFLPPSAVCSDRTVEELGRFCAAEGIAFVSAFDAFREHAGPALYYADDPHWTAEGHRLMARVLEREIRRRSMLPSGASDRSE